MASTAAVLNILVNASTGKAQAELTALDARLKKTAATAQGTSGFMGGKFSKGMVAGAAGFAAVGLAAAAAGKELYDVGKQLDDAYDVIRTGTGATGKQLEQLKKDFRAVARQVPDDFETTGTAIADLNTRLGLTGKPLRGLSRNMLNLSRITKTDLEGNIKSVARAFVDWEVPIKRQGKALNGLFRLGERSGATVSEIADNMQKFGSPLRTLGFNVGEAAAMFANFERAGVNMQTMVPGLKLAIGNLVKPTDELKGTLSGLGVAVANPRKALRQVMDLLGDRSNLTAVEKMSLAMDVFGKRAGADMAEAVKQGRFNLDSFVGTFRKGKDTIDKAARDTNDAGENMAIFWNKVKIAAAPAADAVYNGVSKMSLVLARLPLGRVIGDVRRFIKTNNDLRDVLKFAGGAFKVFASVAKWAFNNVVKEQFRAMLQYLKGGFEVLRGIVRAVSRAFRGDWSGAWAAVKETFRGSVQLVLGVVRGMTAPMRAVTAKIAGVLKNVFGGAWDTVKGIFRDGANAVLGFVKSVVDVINKIPGVPNINIGSTSVGDEGSANVKVPGGHATRRQRGGMLFGGRPSGDSIPAVLERGEYVLNRKAVQKVGVENLNRLNFKHAARFQTGGAVGMNLGGAISDAAGMVADGAKNLPGVGAAANVAGKVLGKGAGYFLSKLPKPDLPSPFTELGPWLIDHVKSWIKDKVPGLGGSLGSLPGDLGKAMALAQSMGLSITSTTGGTHAPGSYHYQGRAFDASNGTNTPEERNYFLAAASKWGGKMLELFYDPIGWYIKNGSKVPGAIGGHSDHVHTAMQQGGLVGLMRGGPAEHAVVKNVGKFLLGRGFDFRATAGILGNAWREGLWNPAQMEFSGLSNGGLYGFTTSPVSLEDLKAFASRRGKPWDDEVVQTNFMLSHGSPTGMAIRGAMNKLGSIPETTEYFMSNWERPLASAAGLSERIGAAYDASSILRGAGIVKAGDEGGMSARDKAKAEKASRREAREGQVRKLIQKAHAAQSITGKKGAYWQILDLFARYGDFGVRRGGATAQGGVSPDAKSFEAAEFLQRAGRIASIANPNRGAGQLYSLVGWLQDNVGLTGLEDGNDRLADRLSEVKSAGGDRAVDRRKTVFSKIAGLSRRFRFKNPLEQADKQISLFGEWADVSERAGTNAGGPGGSDYTDAELSKVVGYYKKILGWQNRKKGLLDVGIPYAAGWMDTYKSEIDRASGNPLERWKVPGFKAAYKLMRSDLGKMRGGLRGLVGLSGQGGDLFETKQRLLELGVTDTVEKQAAAGVSIQDVLSIVEAARNGVYKDLPKFHTGGVIPGSGEQPAMVMGGEGVFTRDQMAAMGTGNLKVEMNFANGMEWLREFVDVRVVENDRKHDLRAKAGV